MYRENEVALAGAVMEARQGGDRKRVMEAAVRFWLAPPEPTSDGSLVRDVWAALVHDQLQSAAVLEVMRLVREKQRIRPDAFVPVMFFATPEQLLELVPLLIESELDAYPYLAVVFERLVSDLGEAKPIEALLRKLHPVAPERTDLWTLGAFTLTTTNVGNRDDVDRWFEGWEDRPDVPMWTIAAYIGTLAQVGIARPRLAAIARKAYETLVPDASEPYLERLVLVDDAVTGNHETLPVRFRAADLGGYVARSPLAEPMVQYANGVRLVQPLDTVDFLYNFETVSGGDVAVGLMFGAIGAARIMANANSQGARPPHWRLVRLYQDMRAPVYRTHVLLGLFVRMLELPKGDPEVMETALEWRRSRPSEVSALVPAWNKLLATRLGWWARTFKL